ncbi:MAG TPA: hypothetical protein VFY69_07205 [Solirubrobacterales bacterium]|nr:hypothetical protein [Solirubrobacterales bacterium]
MLLVAAALAACGGGDGGETSTSAPTAESAPGSEAAGQVQRRAEEIEKERRRQPSGERAEAERGGPDASAPAPPVDHSDSGGGAAQFQRKGGDNSIQEFGAEGEASQLAGAAAVLHAYLDARAAGRWEDACSYLAAEVIAAIEQFSSAYGEERQIEGCPDTLRALTSGAGAAGLRAAANVDVGSLRVQGERGFLLYHGAQDLDYSMPVALEAGEWKLAAPEGTPLP